MNYKLFQVKRGLTRDFGFIGLSMMKDLGLKVNLDNYDLVYEGEIEGETFIALERLFQMFNINHPQDFTGRSMSVSDIVQIDGKNYYCDSFCWKEI